MSCVKLLAGLLLLTGLVTTSHSWQSYDSQVRTMKLVDGRWSDDRASRVSKQDLVHAILNDVTKPVYFPKGNKNIVFGVDRKVHYKDLRFSKFYMNNDVESYISKLIRKPSNRVTKVELFTQRLVSLEDERALMKLSRRQPFSIFLPEHAQIASTLIRVLLGFKTEEKFISAAVYLRDRLNLELFVYSFSVAVLNHPEFRKVRLPQPVNTMPRKFIDEETFNDVYQQVINQLQANVSDPIRITVPVQYTATDREPEQKLAYFREDIEVNMHHWHWHLVYPTSGPDINVVAKDRRGELFYFMHQQMMARYDFERLSNRMPRVLRLNVADSIPEGYYPKLTGPTGGGPWAGRPIGVTLQDLHLVSPTSGSATRVDVADLQRWGNRILDAIQQRRVTAANGSSISLNNIRGIDILGNMVEASMLSPDPDFYGNLHNQGHNIISQGHDPDGRYMEPPGVMADVATAVRDPIFFRWHTHINFIFDQHKQSLDPYKPQELGFEGVSVSSVQVQTKNATTMNRFYTFWEEASVFLDLDFSLNNQMDIIADITRLQNVPFTYQIKVKNSGSQNKRGTVRIFLLPSFGEHGEKYPINEQRASAIEMDRFNIDITPGENTIYRESVDSSVTQPDIYTNNGSDAAINYCGCGWPQHLLVPKGNEAGLESQIFVVITDSTKEEVIDPVPLTEDTCKSSSFCGEYGRKYPTKLPMGFPMDRRITGQDIVYLEDFVKLYPNMVRQSVSIKFSERRAVPVKGCEEERFIATFTSPRFNNPSPDTFFSNPSPDTFFSNPSPDTFFNPERSGYSSPSNNRLRSSGGSTENSHSLVDQFMKGNDLPQNETALLARACYDNKPDVVAALLDLGVNVDAEIHSQELTCLHIAVRRNYPQLAGLLLSRGSNVNTRNQSQRTPLMNAIWAGNLELAELLIQHNADLNVRDENGDTALMWARKKGLANIVKFLESKGALQ